ncbi:hypothetical protein BX600DRAFT_471667 [Xylariales sp. PMI_506]|nr:hypothetical protein BX600DRAFT_471667 [Xylariales sp. PMI_506]
MGRAPTSGYCLNCRKRRVKCDRGRPSCQKCIRSRRQCGGYDVPLRMDIQVGGGPQNFPRGRMVPTPVAEPPRLPPTDLSLEGFQELVAFSHFFEVYHWAHFWRPVLQLQADPHQPVGIYTVSLAMAYGHMSKVYKVPALQVESLRLLQTVVDVVKVTIASGSGEELVNLIPLLVVLFQFDYAIDGINNVAHHYGIQQILKRCGPSVLPADKLAVFCYAREALICQALALKCRLFLEEDEWKSIPWGTTPKTFRDKLTDILVDLPGLRDKVSSLSLLSEKDQNKLSYDIDRRLSQLFRWRWEWEESNSCSAREIAIKPLAGNHDDKHYLASKDMLSTGIEFIVPDQASEILSYNAAIIELVELQCAVHCQLAHMNTPIPRLKHNEGGMTARSELMHRPDKCLLLPNELNFLWQPAIEALRVLACIPQRFSSDTPQTFLTTLPIGILYCFLKKAGLHYLVVAIIGRDLDGKQADIEFDHEQEWEEAFVRAPTPIHDPRTFPPPHDAELLFMRG